MALDSERAAEFGRMGGRASAAALTPEQRVTRARIASARSRSLEVHARALRDAAVHCDVARQLVSAECECTTRSYSLTIAEHAGPRVITFTEHEIGCPLSVAVNGGAL